MHERRLTVRLTGYWDGLRADNTLPIFQQFNSESISDLWPNAMLLHVIHAKAMQPLYQYEYMGPEIVNIYGEDLTGQFVNTKMHNFPGTRVLQRLDEMLHSPRLMVDEGQFISSHSKIVRYRACLLPFGDPRGKITHIVIGLSWQTL